MYTTAVETRERKRDTARKGRNEDERKREREREREREGLELDRSSYFKWQGIYCESCDCMRDEVERSGYSGREACGSVRSCQADCLPFALLPRQHSPSPAPRAVHLVSPLTYIPCLFSVAIRWRPISTSRPRNLSK